MRRLLKDVHHYLFYTSFSPREGDIYETKTHLGKLYVDQLTQDKQELDGRYLLTRE